MVWSVAILALIPALAWAGPPVDAPPPGLRLTISATTERIPLTGLRGPVDLSVDTLARRIRLRLSKKDQAKALAARIASRVGMLCPRVDVKADAVELACQSRRIEAQVTREGKLLYLDINELRGLPWRAGDDGPPVYHYDPWRIGLGQSCPGKNEVSQAECLFKDGNTLEAARHFRKALETSGRQMACVRLGDVAVSIGDPITGAGWYRRAGSFGIFGRVAEARLCELDGRCLQETADVLRTFDPAGMPEPLRAETIMRSVRAEAYSGRLASAGKILSRQIKERGPGSICREGGELLCRRILLEAMRAALPPRPTAILPVNAAERQATGSKQRAPVLPDKAEREAIEELIETYLSLPSWEKGPLAVDLAQAAAPLAVHLGASAFGGNLLASLAPAVPEGRLSDHLLLATETFLQGQNWARARIVTEYAQTRVGAKAMKTPRWTAVLRQLNGADENEVPPAVREAIELQMAATLVDLKSAREVLHRAHGVLGGARDARAAGVAEAQSADQSANRPAPRKSPAILPLGRPGSPPADARAKRVGGPTMPATTRPEAKR